MPIVSPLDEALKLPVAFDDDLSDMGMPLQNEAEAIHCKAKLYKARNKEAARKYRERQKTRQKSAVVRVQQLEAFAQRLQIENAQLKAKNEMLEKQVTYF